MRLEVPILKIMDNDLNLITKEENFEQKTVLVFKILNILFGVILFVTFSFSIYSYIELNKLKVVENGLRSQKDVLSSSVANYNSQEKLLREVNHRYGIYKNFKNEIEDYSEVIREIYVRALGTSVEVININFNYDNKEIQIRVKSNSEQFTRFVNNLKNEDFKGESSVYPNLFYPSSKNEEVDQAIKEYIVYINYRPEVIKK